MNCYKSEKDYGIPHTQNNYWMKHHCVCCHLFTLSLLIG